MNVLVKSLCHQFNKYSKLQRVKKIRMKFDPPLFDREFFFEIYISAEKKNKLIKWPVLSESILLREDSIITVIATH